MKFANKFPKIGTLTLMTKKYSHSSSLLSLWDATCRKGLRALNPVSESNCEHHSHTHQILMHGERRVSLSLNFHVFRYLSLLHQLFSACSIMLSLCITQGRYVLKVWPELDNFAFQGATAVQSHWVQSSFHDLH